MFIPQEIFEEAIEDLAKEEINMHIALTFEGDNPLGKVADRTIEYIKSRKKATIVDLLTEFWKMLPQGKKSMEDVLTHLIGIGQVKQEQEQDELTKNVTIYYTII
jgi:hypothetical protein